MKKIFFKLKSKRKQQGIALIFALAMLSLLLIMAIGFATSSIFEQKAAYNSANTTSARLLSQSAASRVLLLLQSQISLYGETLDYSYDNWSVNKGDKDMLDHLTTDISNIPIYTYNNTHPVTWEYIKTNDGATDRLIGRFAYVVIPIGGINPAAVVKSGTREEQVIEQRVGARVDEINIMAVSPSDIVLSASPGANQVSAGKFNYAATSGSSPAGKLPAAGYWTSLTNMFSVMGITSGSLKSKFLKWFVAGSSTTAFDQRECFWADRNGNGATDSVTGTNDELFHRFNIYNRAATSWDSFTSNDSENLINAKLLCDANDDNIPDTLPPPYPPPPAAFPVANEGLGIPWLAFFGYDKNGVVDETGSLKGTFPNVTARRHQIAANLIDYCDSNTDNPTYDTKNCTRSVWINSGVANDPLYTGNELTPYINEAGLRLHVDITRTNTNITVKFAPEIDLEAINIYAISDIPVWMAVRYSFEYKIVLDGVTTSYTETPTPVFSSMNWPSAGSLRYATKNFIENTTATIARTFNVASGSSHVISVTDCKLTVDKVVLSTTTAAPGSVDCALIKKSSSVWKMISNWTSTAAASTGAEFSVAFQTNDPRQNLNPDDWSMTETPFAAVAPASALYASVGTLGYKNIFNGVAVDPSAPSPDKDLEVVTDPAYNPSAAAGLRTLSTAYIRNGVMLSPWELGFIHRGVAWQTLNLKEYDPNKANKFVAANVPSAAYPYARIPGGGAYSDTVNGGGDANILNQVKIGTASVLGNLTSNCKININSAYVDSSTGKNITLQALLTNIKIGSTISSPGTGGTSITGIDNLVSSIMTKTNGMDYITRAEVANTMYCAGPGSYKRALSESVCGVIQDTDAKQEELIGKFINLTDVGGKNNYFYVIVVAQAIKDVGGPSGGTADITIKKKKSDGTVITIPARLGQFDCDAANNIYVDEITGEQKIRLLVFADPADSNKCKVLSFEFIE